MGQLGAKEAEIALLKSHLENAKNIASDREKKIILLETELDEKNNTIKELEEQIRDDDVVRKKLHNTIQVRPLSADPVGTQREHPRVLQDQALPRRGDPRIGFRAGAFRVPSPQRQEHGHRYPARTPSCLVLC